MLTKIKRKPVEKPRCKDCGNVLSNTTLEIRSDGYSEFIIYCKCGATYTS